MVPRLPAGVTALAVAITGVIGGGAAAAVTRAQPAPAPRPPLTAPGPRPATAAPGGGAARPPAAAGAAAPGTVARSPGATPGPEHAGTAVTAAVRGRPAPRPVTPDLEIVFPGPAAPAVIRRLEQLPGVTASSVLALGAAKTPAGRLTAVGVDPATFRRFTPALTDASGPLWASVSRGEATLSFSVVRSRRGLLGRTEQFAARRAAALRIGAFASIGLPAAGMMVDQAGARALGLAPRRAVILAAPAVPPASLAAAARAVVGPGPAVHDLAPRAVNQGEISALASETIPANYLQLYRQAALTCPGLPWTVLAAIGGVETGHGRDDHVSSAGAEGPMQFMPSTFAEYGYDPYHGRPNVWSPVDAIYSAARYLCAQGAGRGGQSLLDAIYAYNHAGWYVNEVLALAGSYG